MNSEAFSSSISTGINFEKFTDIKVDVRGKEPPKHVEAIADSGLNDVIMKNMYTVGYKTLTPIQKYAVPIILAKRDLVAAAQTGSGKTAAFLLPIIHQMHSSGTKEHVSKTTQCPTCLIITPTRELALQIHAEANRFSVRLNMKCCLAYGGKNMQEQLADLSHGCDILIATPGRLLDYIENNVVSLEMVKYAVLDEADRMLDIGFLPDVKRILQNPMIPPVGSKQTVMFSATFPLPIQKLASTFLDNYLFVGVGVVGGACTDVEQTFYCIADEAVKFQKVLEILRANESVKTMVFLRTKAKVRRLYKKLSQAGFNCSSIHGDRSQSQREEALLNFRTGRTSTLMCTNVVARGLDIPDVGHVINYDLPQDIDEYIHRIGRTGRVGNIGRATSFYIRNANIEVAKDLVTVLRKANQAIPDWLIEEANLRVTHKDIKQMRKDHKLDEKISPHLRASVSKPAEVVTSQPQQSTTPPVTASSTVHPMWDSKMSRKLINEISQKTKMELGLTHKRLQGNRYVCHATLGHEYSVSVEGTSQKDSTVQACDELMKILPEDIIGLLGKKSKRRKR